MSDQIRYAAISRGHTILVSCQMGSGDDEEAVFHVLQDVDSRRDTKLTTSLANSLNLHMLVNGGIVYLCITPESAGKRGPYTFLNEVKKKFTSGSLAIRAQHAESYELQRDFSTVLEDLVVKSNRGQLGENLGHLHSQVEEVKVVMTENIERILERGDKIDTLLDKTAELEGTSIHFRSSSRKLQRKMAWKNCRMWIILIVIVAIIIILIALFASNVIPVGGS